MADDHDPRSMLLVVDIQNGFVNDHTRHIIEIVNALIAAFSGRGEPVALTRFVNIPGSGHERWIGWTRFMHEPENALANALAAGSNPVFVKHGYTAFTPEFENHVREQRIARLVLCGIATDGCVLKSAVDAFERGIEPVVLTNACASHAGREIHDAGLLLLSRFIGPGQLKSAADFV
jgi:nicotinamidase-related amidase